MNILFKSLTVLALIAPAPLMANQTVENFGQSVCEKITITMKDGSGESVERCKTDTNGTT